MLVIKMGTLKPDTSYVYENADGIVYAREFGAATNTRFEIGRTYDRKKEDIKLSESVLWADILEEAKTNPALQDAVEKCKMLYYLSKK
jgi:hypothetical protein